MESTNLDLRTDNSDRLRPKIFISHRHEESHIARIIHNALRLWHFRNEDIYYSSEPMNNPPPGEDLHRSIARAAYEAKLFILVYTISDGNWDWVMHESGLATDPRPFFSGNEPNTRIVIFQCFDECPQIFSPLLRVTIDENSILNFVTSILTEDGFLPGEDAPRPDLRNDSSTLRQFARPLYQQLEQAISSIIPSSSRRPRIQCRWDYFTVELDSNSIEKARGSNNRAEKLNLISTQSLVIGRYALGLNHFGYNFNPDLERHFDIDRNIRNENIKLQNLFERWIEKSKYSDSDLPNWAIGILEEMKRTIDLEYADPPRFLMKSLYIHKEDWFYPVVNTVRRLFNGNMEFDIYMFRLPSNLPWLNEDNI